MLQSFRLIPHKKDSIHSVFKNNGNHILLPPSDANIGQHMKFQNEGIKDKSKVMKKT